MISLGYFFQQKKLSLQAQQNEAHGAFLRVIDLMRSTKPIDHIEAIQLCGQICSRYASPTIVNSAFMRMAEGFRTGSNTLQLEILRVIQRNTENLRKIHNHTEFIRPIFTVMYSNDPVGRAITLRLLAAIAVSIPDQLEVHHAVRMALQSKDRDELDAALYACKNLARVSAKFADEIAADVLALMEKHGLSDDEKIAALQIIPYISSSSLDTDLLMATVIKLLPSSSAFQSSRLVETCLRIISDLVRAAISPTSAEQHLQRLVSFVHHERPEIARPSADELDRFFRFCCSRIPGDVIVGFLRILFSSEKPFVVKQGIKCAFNFVNNPLGDHAPCFHDGEIIQLISNCGLNFQNSAGGCAFSVLCKLVTLMADISSADVLNHSSVAGMGLQVQPKSETSQLLFGTCSTVVALGKALAAAAVKKSDTQILKFVLLGLQNHNRERFPEWLQKQSLQLIPEFSHQRAPFQEWIMSFLSDVSKKEPSTALALMNQMYSDNTFFTSTYRIILHSTAIRIRAVAGIDKELDKKLAKKIVTDFELSCWDLYRLGRTAMADGRHDFASHMFDALLNVSEVKRAAFSNNWITILRHLAQSEASKGEILNADLSLDGATAIINKSLLDQMDVQLKVGEYQTSNAFGCFKKAYIDMRMNVQRSLQSVLQALDKIRQQAARMRDLDGISEILSSHLVATIKKLEGTAQEVTKVYKLCFDADGTSLAIIRLNRYICFAVSRALAAVIGQTLFAETAIVPSKPSCFPKILPLLDRLEKLRGISTVTFLPEDMYDVLRELFDITKLCLVFPMPLPRYFFQQFQQTTLAVNLTPSRHPESEYVQVLTMDTKFTLKVDGVVSVERRKGCSLMRTVKMVRVVAKIILLKSLPFSSKVAYRSEITPDLMTQSLPLNGSNFFSHSFVMLLGYPGIYRIDVDFEFIDDSSGTWSAAQTADLKVKVVEGIGIGGKRRQQEGPANRN